MTVLNTIALRCVWCDRDFDTSAVVSTNSFGGKRTDFHERAAGTQPLPYLVHACPRCGFTGAERDFGTVVIDTYQRALLAGVVTPFGGDAPPCGSDKYDRAARICEVLCAGEHRQIADLWLRAAWCAVDERDTEAERFYRLRAVRAFEQSMGGDLGDERPLVTYLIGELWRRIGDAEKACEWFDRVPSEITDAHMQQWILDVAAQQRHRPREWFG